MRGEAAVSGSVPSVSQSRLNICNIYTREILKTTLSLRKIIPKCIKSSQQMVKRGKRGEKNSTFLNTKNIPCFPPKSRSRSCAPLTAVNHWAPVSAENNTLPESGDNAAKLAIAVRTFPASLSK